MRFRCTGREPLCRLAAETMAPSVRLSYFRAASCGHVEPQGIAEVEGISPDERKRGSCTPLDAFLPEAVTQA